VEKVKNNLSDGVAEDTLDLDVAALEVTLSLSPHSCAMGQGDGITLDSCCGEVANEPGFQSALDNNGEQLFCRLVP